MVQLVIDHAKLARSHAVYGFTGVHHVSAVTPVLQPTSVKLGRVAYLEGHLLRGESVARQEMEVRQGEIALVSRGGVITMADVKDVALHVFLHHEPRATAHAKPLALAYSVKPQPLVLAYFPSRLQLDDVSGLLAQVSLYVLVVVDVAQETDALAVLAPGGHEMFPLGYLPHLVFHVVAYRENGLPQLPALYLRQEVRLVFHGVGAGGKPFLAVYHLGLGVVTRGYQVILIALLLVESPKLDEPVAHHVWIGRIARLHLLHGVAGHLPPVFLVAVHHLQATTETPGHGGGHLQVFLAAAVPFLLFLGTYLDIKAVRREPRLRQFPHHNAAVHAAREQHGHPLVSDFFQVHAAKIIIFLETGTMHGGKIEIPA